MTSKRTSASYTLLAVFITLIGILFPLVVPLPRQIGLSVRYDWIPALAGGAILFLLWSRKTLPWQILSLGLITLLFVLSLTGLWSSGQSEVYVLNGLIPWNDASHYFTDALRVLAGSSMEAFSTRRPLAPLFFSLLLFFSAGNIQVVQVALALLNALGCFIAGKEIQRQFNSAAAAVFVMILFLFSRRFTGMLMTENLGMPLGCLGFALLWQGARQDKFWPVVVGIVSITLALNARAGAFFVIPLILIGASWIYCRRFRHIPKNIILILALCSGFLINWMAFVLVSPPGAMLFSNFADTLYGAVVGGKGWEQVSLDYPQIEKLPEDQRASAIYSLAWDHFKQQPQLLITGSFNSWKEFLSLSENSVFGFINGERKNEVKLSNLAGSLALYLFSLLGLYFLLKNWNKPFSILALLAWIGVLCSVPFVPPQDATRMRVYAATIPLITLLPALGIYAVWEMIRRKTIHLDLPPLEDVSQLSLPMLSNLTLILLVCSAGLVLKALPRESLNQNNNCQPGEEALVFPISQGSYIHVVANETGEQDWLPTLKQNRFVIGVHGISTGYADALGDKKAPFYLMGGINLLNKQSVFLIIPDQAGSVKNGQAALCGVKTNNPTLDSMNFFEVKSIAY